jgi:cell division protein FtsN
MSKNSSRSAGGGTGGGFPIFAAIMLGIVLGLALAGGIALLIMKKTPVTLAPKEVREAPKPSPEPVIAPPKGAKPAEDKARFEFYKELPDKQDNGKPARKTDKPAPDASKPTTTAPATAHTPAKQADKTTYLLQAGSFPNADDAEKVKARLALLGMEANVQPANIPDKGTWYRVRLGPYHGADEMNAALNTLKQNGINAAPIKAQ